MDCSNGACGKWGRQSVVLWVVGMLALGSAAVGQPPRSRKRASSLSSFSPIKLYDPAPSDLHLTDDEIIYFDSNNDNREISVLDSDMHQLLPPCRAARHLTTVSVKHLERLWSNGISIMSYHNPRNTRYIGLIMSAWVKLIEASGGLVELQIEDIRSHRETVSLALKHVQTNERYSVLFVPVSDNQVKKSLCGSVLIEQLEKLVSGRTAAVNALFKGDDLYLSPVEEFAV
eukprot:Lankesteria_metandrocarpae@DN3765_c0_g1_i1.p1